MKTFDEIKEVLLRHKEAFREQYGLKRILLDYLNDILESITDIREFTEL